MAEYNAANRKHVRAAEKRLILVNTVNREVICGLMSIANGRQWVYERLEAGGVFQTPFSPDPYLTAFNEGKRSAAIELFNDVMLYCPTLLEPMLKEAHARSTATERSLDTNRDRGDQGPVERNDDAGAVDYDHDPYRDDNFRDQAGG